MVTLPPHPVDLKNQEIPQIKPVKQQETGQDISKSITT